MNSTNNANLIAEGQRDIARAARAWFSRVASQLRLMRQGWIERRRRHHELVDLYRLSDRELWDVGLSRSDFPAIEKGIYRRK